jgi:hypothetical protein
MNAAARVHSVDVHHLNFNDKGSIFEVPALAAKSSEQVSDIYIRHYRSWLRHVCKLVLSPSIPSYISQLASTDPPSAVSVPLHVYITFAACGQFKVYYDGNIFLQSDAEHQGWRLYGAYVSVSPGGMFSVVVESCTEQKQFIGCFGSQVCTGFNDRGGWMCTREQPPDDWMRSRSRVKLQQNGSPPRCNITDESSIWSFFNNDAQDHQCMGLLAFPSAADIISCSQACCSDAACSRFQWSSGIINETVSGTKCWLGRSIDCQRRAPGFVNGILRSAEASDHTPGWHRAVTTGASTTFRSLEAGAHARARWVWPEPQTSTVEPRIFCRWSID